MKKRVQEWLPMVLIAWGDKLRINLKYLKQFFSAPRFHKCLKSHKRVGKWLTSVAVYPCQNSVLELLVLVKHGKTSILVLLDLNTYNY